MVKVGGCSFPTVHALVGAARLAVSQKLTFGIVQFRRSLKSVDKGSSASGAPLDVVRQHHSVPIPSKQAPLKVSP